MVVATIQTVLATSAVVVATESLTGHVSGEDVGRYLRLPHAILVVRRTVIRAELVAPRGRQRVHSERLLDLGNRIHSVILSVIPILYVP